MQKRMWQLNRQKIALLACLCAVMLSIAFFASRQTVYAQPDETEPSQENLSQNVDSILDQLDLSDLEQYLQSLSQDELSLFGSVSAVERIRLIVSGKHEIDYGNFFSYLAAVIGVEVLAFMPVVLGILAIAVAVSILNSSRSKFASQSVGAVISFSSVALTATILATQIMMLVAAVRTLIVSLQTQMNIVFPLILTLMAAAGAPASAGVYQPAVAIMAGGIMELIVVAVLPLFILSGVFTVVGNLSETVRLKKMSEFFMKACKWLLSTAFFLFLAFLSVQGITASVYDGVSVRTAKFAISKYVPVIGGYLSDGFNLVMAGSVLVKNAIGMTAVILLVLSILPTVINAIVFSLSLHLCAAIVEPLGDKRVGNILTELAKNTGTLVAMLLGAAFLYFIFLILVICTGNLAL